MSPHLWFIRLIGVIVPRRVRSDWQQEWEAELACREALLADWEKLTGNKRLDLFRRSLGAFWDALWLQTYRWEDEMIRDLRFGLRMLTRYPGFASIAVLSLALGIGANAAIFSLINNALIRSLPYQQPDRLVRITEWYPQGAFSALQERSRTMEIAAYLPDSEFNLTGRGEPVHLTGCMTSANLLSVIGARPELGRVFAKGEDRPGQDNIVILSHWLWRNKFDGDPSVIGRAVTIEGMSREIVGVMPADFGFPSPSVQLWIPLHLDPGNFLTYWAKGWMALIGRLEPGVAVQPAQEEIRALISQTVLLFPYPVPTTWNADATVVLLQETIVGDIKGKLLVLLCAVGFVLLIACANVASLLLARTAARQREIAIRCALGAGRGRIVRQLLTESLVLALLGGTLGVALATKGLSIVKSVLPADNLSLVNAAIDWRVLVFVGGLAILTGLAFGLFPALGAGRLDLAEAFKTRGQSSGGIAGTRVRNSLIIGEVALSVVLIVGAGLLIKTLWRLTQVNPGFQPESLLTIRVFPSRSIYPERGARIALYDELLRRTHGISGVSAVAASSTLPLSGDLSAIPVEVEDHPLNPSDNVATMLWAGAVTPEYFDVMRVPLLQGRVFGATDSVNSDPVIVVSAATAQHFWPGQNALGKHIRAVWEKEWRTVVGVVSDVRQYDMADKSPDFVSGAFYMPYPQSVGLDREIPTNMNLILRTTSRPAEIGAQVRELVTSVNPNIPVAEPQALEKSVSVSISPSRALMWLFVSFAGTALILAIIGTYGVVSYTTVRRTGEFGLRVALGASRSSIFGLVIGQSLRLVLTGLTLGVVAALGLTRMMASFLYGVGATDPVTFIAVSALLLVVALLAGYFPARRACLVDPMTALRCE